MTDMSMIPGANGIDGLRATKMNGDSAATIELYPRVCPVCGSDVARELAPANVDFGRLDGFAFASRKRPEYMHFRLVVCDACDLLYASPAPARAHIERAYQAASFDASEESRSAAATYAKFLPKICRGLPDRCGALDIGTGDGAFLARLVQEGFRDVQGVEPSAAPIAAADAALRARIRHSPFRTEDFRAEQFRLVTCFQTMEHVFEPLQLCRDAFRIIKPEGAFFIICHNRRAVLARVMGRKSPIFDIEHLQLFSPDSVRRLLRRAGFRRIEVRTVVNRYPASYWARLIPAPAALKDALLSTLASTGLGRLTIAAPVGNLAAIAWR